MGEKSVLLIYVKSFQIFLRQIVLHWKMEELSNALHSVEIRRILLSPILKSLVKNVVKPPQNSIFQHI